MKFIIKKEKTDVILHRFFSAKVDKQQRILGENEQTIHFYKTGGTGWT